MKKTNKFLALLMAVVMVFAMSVSAFAAEVGTANITIKTGTDEYYYTAEAGQTLKAFLDSKTAELEPTWKNVPDWQDPAIMHQALVSLSGVEEGAATDDDLVGMVDYPYTWIPGHPGYAEIGRTVNEKGETVYHYMYAGWAWTYYEADAAGNKTADIWDYMCCYNLRPDTNIVIEYSLNISDWTTTTPLQ